jgi:tetratricopeptide (TPR) repeat protein
MGIFCLVHRVLHKKASQYFLMINKPLSPSIEELASQALALHQNGQFEDACTIYDQLLSDSPDNAELLYFRGALATQMGDHNHALELLRKAAEGAPHIANIPYRP